MSKTLSSLLKLTVAGAVLLSVGACKPADKGQGALKSEGLKALNLSKADSSVFAKYFDTGACEIDELESLGALAGLGLGETNDKGIAFSSRDVANGKVIYQGLTLTQDGSDTQSFTADEAVFHCPKMSEDKPTFDRLDLTNVSIFDTTDNVEFTAKTVNIASPTPEGARSIVDSMISADTKPRQNIGFEAFSITEASIKSKDANGTLAALTWGAIRGEDGKGTADLSLEDVDFKVPGKNGGQETSLGFEGMSIRSMRLGKEAQSNAAPSPDQLLAQTLGNLSFFEKPYDEFIIENMTLNSESMDIDFAGIEGKTTEKSGVITTRQTLKPLLINFKPALAEDPSFQQQYEIIKSLDLETIKLSGSSVTKLDKSDDSISVSDGLFIIEDAMRLNFEYEAEGLQAMTDKMEALSASGSNADPIAGLEALKLRGFRLTLEDNSIVDKGLTLATQMTGQSESNLKRMLAGLVFAAPLAAENDLQAEIYGETAEAFVNFVKKGGTLTLEANPPAPVSLAPALSGQGGDIDPKSLGFSANQEGGAE